MNILLLIDPPAAADGTPARIPAALFQRLLAASYGLRMPLADIIHAGIRLAVQQYEQTGRLAVPFTPAPACLLPPLNLSDKTRRRMAELDDALETEPGEGFAEVLCSSLIDDLKNGDTGFLEAWSWQGEAEVKASVWALAARWSAEDAAEESNTTSPGKEVAA